jgi:hypothetical protein
MFPALQIALDHRRRVRVRVGGHPPGLPFLG